MGLSYYCSLSQTAHADHFCHKTADNVGIMAKTLEVGGVFLTALLTAILCRIFYMQRLHPLANFPGPWWATSFSVVGAIISVMHKEPEFFMCLVKKYGNKRYSKFI
jgi:hypothetical protein